jgi:hypothetical protein
MDIKKTLKGFFSLGAIYYTVISVFIILVGMALSDGGAAKLLVPQQFLYLLLFCYVMALGSTLKKQASLSATVAQLLHAACYILGFMLFLILCNMKFVPVIIATAVFAIFYIVAVLISNAVKKKSAPAPAKQNTQTKTVTKKEKPKKTAEYTSQFSFDSQNNHK